MKADLIAIPTEVLENCIVPFLQQDEQLQLLSCCTNWLPLLHQIRTISISTTSTANYISRITCTYEKYYYYSKTWLYFCESEAHRRKVLAILRCPTLVDTTNQPIQRKDSSRRLKLIIDIANALKYKELICQYVEYMREVTFTASDGFQPLPSRLLPVTIEYPTVIALQRWFASQQVSISYRNLSELYVLLQQKVMLLLPKDVQPISQQDDEQGQRKGQIGEKQEPSLHLLQDIRRIWLSGDGHCFLEINPHPTASCLQCVVLDGCDHIVDLKPLQGIPDVKLIACIGVIEIQALSQAKHVTIRRCSQIRDVSSLANMTQVFLEGMVMEDISMLGNVTRLVLHHCTVQKYPVPNGHSAQDWEIANMDIIDLIGFDRLYTLTLIQCAHVKDISMLGSVQYLHINSCESIRNLPKPIGGSRQQEWTFANVAFTKMKSFAFTDFISLHKLTLESCRIGQEIRQLSDIQQVFIRDCADVRIIQQLENIHQFHVQDCKALKGIHCIVNVQKIHIESCPAITSFTASLGSSLKYLHIAGCYHLQRLWIETPLSSLIIEGCRAINHIQIESEEDIEWMMIDRCPELAHGITYTTRRSEVPPLPKRRIIPFDNFSIRLAVDLWIADKIRACHIYGDITNWDVSQVTDMSYLFHKAKTFNEAIGSWNVHQVTTMCRMFSGAIAFNQPLDAWDVAKVEDMSYMFHEAKSFNQSLQAWDIRSVKEMRGMFYNASVFDRSLISSWHSKFNQRQVIGINQLFLEAHLFHSSWFQNRLFQLAVIGVAVILIVAQIWN